MNMCLLPTVPLLLLVLVLVVETTQTSHASLAFQPVVVVSRSTSSTSSSSSLVVLLAKKRGASNSNAKDLRKTVGGGMGSSSSPTGTTSRNDINWCPMPLTEKAKMPTMDNQIVLLDTELPTMKNSATNPTGAVAVTKFNGQTFCFASSCPTCQIPLTKAQILPPHVAAVSTTSTSAGGDGHARLVCDLCKSTYSLGTGLKIKDPAAGAVATGGILSSVVKSLFSANPDNAQRPLKLYKLGEKANGQLVIDVE